LVTDSIAFDLEIGSTYLLKSVTLERRNSDSGYQAVQSIATVANKLAMVLTDQLSEAGRYTYRTRLETVAGRVFYSQEEAVDYLRAKDLLVFPNPAQAGTSLSVIAGTQNEITMELYDAMGRFQRTATANGSINSIDTNGLRPGVYLLRVQAKDGPTTTRRVVIL
jgi:hypothetical protein